jgi:hypothetical protein
MWEGRPPFALRRYFITQGNLLLHVATLCTVFETQTALMHPAIITSANCFWVTHYFTE